MAKILPLIEPIAPTLVAEPSHRDGWIYQEKVDGWRIVAYKDRTHVRLISRRAIQPPRPYCLILRETVA